MGKETDRTVPRQRTTDLVILGHGEGTLVLDRRTGTVHYLPAEVAQVWVACTGRGVLADIASAAGTDEHIAAGAVDQLTALDLLDVPRGFDRRKFLRRSALAGAGTLTIPVIESVAAPPAWAAGSREFQFLSGCGGSGNGTVQWGATFTSWPAGTYTVMVQGMSPITGEAVTQTRSVTIDGTGNGTIPLDSFGGAGAFPPPSPFDEGYQVDIVITGPDQYRRELTQTIDPCPRQPYGSFTIDIDPGSITCDTVKGELTFKVQLIGWTRNTSYFVQGSNSFVFPAVRERVSTDSNGFAESGVETYPTLNYQGTPFTINVYATQTGGTPIGSRTFTLPPCLATTGGLTPSPASSTEPTPTSSPASSPSTAHPSAQQDRAHDGHLPPGARKDDAGRAQAPRGLHQHGRLPPDEGRYG